jgi:RNA polymerase sigma factor (sigma-70 family)
LDTIQRDIRTLFLSGAVGGLSDGRLLEQFVASRDEFAFERLIERHGPMVWGVCRRVLGDHHDAEDAFQAAFLVLARRAASVCPRESVGGWLHGVATRTAHKARTTAARRKAREHRLASWTRPTQPGLERNIDLAAMLDFELARLPESQRSAIVLCDLEGRTRAEAARHLGWPEGTLASRLARGRARLAARLTRQGLAPVDSEDPTRAHPGQLILPAGLAARASHAATLNLTGSLPAGLISARALALADLGTRLAGLPTTLLTLTVLTLGIGGGFSYLALDSHAFQPPAARATATLNGDEPIAKAQATTELKRREDELAAAAFEKRQALLVEATRSATERAVQVVSKVDSLEQRVWMLCELVRLQKQAGFGESFQKTIELAILAAEESDSDHRRNDVVSCLAEVGRSRSATRNLRSIRSRYERERALSGIANGMARAGELAGALRIAASIEGEQFREEAYWTIARARAETGDIPGAIQAAAFLTAPRGRTMALAAIASAQLKANDPAAAATIKEAGKAVDAILDPKFPEIDRSTELAFLAGLLAESGDDTHAFETARKVNQPRWNEIAIMLIAQAQAGRGAIKESTATAARIESAEVRSEAQSSIVEALDRAGEFDQARRLADGIESESWKLRAQLDLARSLVNAGKRPAADALFARALDAIRRLPDDQIIGQTSIRRSGSLSKLARAQASAGEDRTVSAWIDRETSPIARGWALIGLVGGLLDRFKEAEEGFRRQTGRPAPPRPPSTIPAEEALAAVPPAPDAIPAPPLAEPRDSYRGKLILFGTARIGRPNVDSIEAMNLDGSDPETLLILGKDELGKDESIEHGRLSPDGSRLAFNVVRQAAKGGVFSSLWIFSAKGGRKKLADNAIVMAWSPDETQVVALRYRGEFKGGEPAEKILIDASTGQIRPLPLPETDLVSDWSPDGQSFAVIESNPKLTYEQKGIYPLRRLSLVKPDGTGRKPFTIGPPDHDSINPRFSPDGKRLAFTEVRHIGGRRQQHAVVQSLDGSPPQDLASIRDMELGNHEFDLHDMPCWSPDGKTVTWELGRQKVSSSPRHIELFTVTPATGKITRLDLDKLGITGIGSLDWR